MRSNERKNRHLCLAAFMLVLMLVAVLPAMAEKDPISFGVEAEPTSLDAPGEIQVKLTLQNVSDASMAEPVTVYDPNDAILTAFGDNGSALLGAGETLNYEGVWNVTQAELDAGEIAYTARYHLQDESGELVELSSIAPIRLTFTGEKVALTAERKVSPEIVRSGASLTVVYTLTNNGNVELTDISVKESISKTKQTVKSLAPGEKTEVTFTTRIGNADLTSSAVITYKVSGKAESQKLEVGEQVIPVAVPNMKFAVSAVNNAVNVGEAVTLTATFTNEGNITYSDVTVRDEKLGDLFTGISVPAGETVTAETQVVLTEPVTVKAVATLPDNTGDTPRTMKADALEISVFDPEKALLLTVDLACDDETVHTLPADVLFRITVTNNSNIPAKNVAITHGEVAIHTIKDLAPGASTTITRAFRISEAGKFRFTATVKDEMTNTVSFESNTLQMVYSAITPVPTAVPVVTVAPPVHVTPVPSDPILSQARSGFMYAGMALAGLFGIALLLFIISTVVRAGNKKRSEQAYDHLELRTQRGEDETEAPEAENKQPETEPVRTVEKVELPHEKLIGEEQAKPAEEEKAAPETPARDVTQNDEGGFRITRMDDEEKSAEKPAPVQPRRQRTEDEE